MRKQIFLLLITGLVIINSGCVKHIKDNYVDNQKLKENLQGILDKHLAAYQTKFPGKNIGFGLYVKSAGSSVKGGGKLFRKNMEQLFISGEQAPLKLLRLPVFLRSSRRVN